MAAASFSGPREDGSVAHTQSCTQAAGDENSPVVSSTDRGLFPGSQTLTKTLIYVTWQLFYTISCPLKILKETVVFYYVLYNLLAFKDDFPLLFLLVVLPVPFSLLQVGICQCGRGAVWDHGQMTV